jgi:hypothetical protein
VSAATVNPGSMMPHRITLTDVAAMAEADEHHKYELTPEGALVVMTPPTLEHQRIVGRLFAWFLSHGYCGVTSMGRGHASIHPAKISDARDYKR